MRVKGSLAVVIARAIGLPSLDKTAKVQELLTWQHALQLEEEDEKAYYIHEFDLSARGENG